jgi:Secretion system C-terminal sorting domain
MGKFLHLQVPEKCSENWDSMTPEMQGRYCDSCKKTVIDFTEMTDTQLINFFKSQPQNVCGRFYTDQLDKQMALPKKELPRLKYFFTITLPAFLFAQKSNGQQRLVKQKTHFLQRDYKPKELLKNISLNEEKDSVVNLEEVRITCTSRSQETKSFIMGATISGFTIHTINSIYGKKTEKVIVTNAISIYPNPILENSKMQLKWDVAVYSNQYIEIFNANGILLQKEIIQISIKSLDASIWLKQLPKGFYIIKITDSKTQKSLSREFIVQ